MRDAAVDVYTDMWLSFVRYLDLYNIELHEVTRDDLVVYLTKRPRAGVPLKQRDGAPPRATKPKRTRGRPHVPEIVSDRYAARLLRLIAKLTAFNAKQRGLEQSSTAAAEMLKEEPYRSVHLRKNNPLPDPLSTTEAISLLRLIMLPPTSLHPDAPRTPVAVRDYCAVALQLGAGLTPHEVRSLQLDSVLLDAEQTGRPIGLTVPRNGNTQARQTPLSRYARKALASWLDARRHHKAMADSPFLLPSSRGGQWPKNGLYEACEAVCALAGVQLGGGYRLRHTFIVRQIRESRRPGSKLTTATIARWVGFKDAGESLAPYQKLLDDRDPTPT